MLCVQSEWGNNQFKAYEFSHNDARSTWSHVISVRLLQNNNLIFYLVSKQNGANKQYEFIWFHSEGCTQSVWMIMVSVIMMQTLFKFICLSHNDSQIILIYAMSVRILQNNNLIFYLVSKQNGANQNQMNSYAFNQVCANTQYECVWLRAEQCKRQFEFVWFQSEWFKNNLNSFEILS